MRSLSPSIRAKAIEIANTLMIRDKLGRQEAIQVSIMEARRLAKTSNAPVSLSTEFVVPQA